MISKNTESLLTYRYLKGIGKKYLNDLIVAVEITGNSLSDCFYYKFKNSYSSGEMEIAFNKAKEQVIIARKYGHKIISRLDNDYPERLKIVHDAPPILFCAGNINLLKYPDIITIIGTREPTAHGEIISERVTHWFTANGWVIASGLAKGIDTNAHKACLDIGGRTISILAHGLEKIYPAKNKKLASDIIDNNGLLITEYSYGAEITRSNFVERDRIQAALAKAVVLVQSDLTGGSLHASRAILEYERYLIVLGQSSTDISNNEEKITANMVLIQGSNNQKCSLLKTNHENLEKLIHLENKGADNLLIHLCIVTVLP